MEIKQFEDKSLSHFSYAILSNREIMLIDPARDTQQYHEYAKNNKARITGVIETHAHADFVSSHLELYVELGAPVYVSKTLNASYPHQPFNEGQHIKLGNTRLTAIDTPGHSPDGISIVLEDDGKPRAVFTGDTLFVGDCGRPDLREDNENSQSSKEQLAAQLYHTLQNKLKLLPDEVNVYPAHGAGSLCGNSLSDAKSSTIKKEKETNWCLQSITEKNFVETLLGEQPFVPKYFPFDVQLNIQGAPNMHESLQKIRTTTIKDEPGVERLNHLLWIIDTRAGALFKKGHLTRSINVINQTKFETWLGSIIDPGEQFYLAAENETELQKVLLRCASIGYESQISEALVIGYTNEQTKKLDLDYFKKNTDAFTIIDVRNESEIAEKPAFMNSIAVPLHKLRERIKEIPANKPLVVHCASGFRSAAGSSLLQSALSDKIKVYDMGEAIKQFF